MIDTNIVNITLIYHKATFVNSQHQNSNSTQPVLVIMSSSKGNALAIKRRSCQLIPYKVDLQTKVV